MVNNLYHIFLAAKLWKETLRPNKNDQHYIKYYYEHYNIHLKINY